MKIIDGKKISAQIRANTKKQVAKMADKPCLAVILVGNNASSQIYVSKKEEACAEVGIKFEKFLYKKITTEKLVSIIKKLNERKEITGILVQLPLPKNINTQKIINTISNKKDVDGFRKNTRVLSPVYDAIFESLKYARINPKNKTVAILSNSSTFGNPLKIILKKSGAKPKIYLKPKKTTFKEDIIISALGKPKFITADMAKNAVALIDIGITRVAGKVYGDADFETFQDKKIWITPVPGGIGPMTVALLLRNVLELSKK
jgi:methylenetetrahydrofolate dehydrogenase (NADP+)/methenyltetrahydrofolate cyclohydrolase